jgi:hypothetical protein
MRGNLCATLNFGAAARSPASSTFPDPAGGFPRAERPLQANWRLGEACTLLGCHCGYQRWLGAQRQGLALPSVAARSRTLSCNLLRRSAAASHHGVREMGVRTIRIPANSRSSRAPWRRVLRNVLSRERGAATVYINFPDHGWRIDRLERFADTVYVAPACARAFCRDSVHWQPRHGGIPPAT